MNKRIKKLIFILGPDDTELDSMLPNQRLNRNQQQTHTSEKQTLKIEEVFTSSTRRSGT
jgi:hypothetical protein